MMLWTAPTTCIAIEQNAIGFEEQWRRCELPLLAKNGLSGHASGMSAFPPEAGVAEDNPQIPILKSSAVS
jgi:hypothetical protein